MFGYIPKELNRASTKQLETSTKNQYDKSVGIFVNTTCNKKVDKNKGTLITSEKEETARDGYFHMHKCVKKCLHSIYEQYCASQETTISMIKDIVDI